MSRAEADALYQAGVLNAKNLVGATNAVVATALRLNVPFRSRPGGGAQGAAHSLQLMGIRKCLAFNFRISGMKPSPRTLRSWRALVVLQCLA